MGRHTKEDWALAAAGAVVWAAVGLFIGESAANVPLGLVVSLGFPFAFWCVIRAAVWNIDPLSRAGTVAGLCGVMLPVFWAMQSDGFRTQPVPLTFSERRLRLSEALGELRAAGFGVDDAAWTLEPSWISLPSRRPTFAELDEALRLAGARVTFDYDYARASLRYGTAKRWSIATRPVFRGPIRWVERAGARSLDGLA